MFTVSLLARKGGTGKTTIADDFSPAAHRQLRLFGEALYELFRWHGRHPIDGE